MPDSWGSLRRRMASRADGAWYSLSGGGSPDGTLGPMKPYGTNIVTFRVLLAGYEQAVNRFGQVSRSRDPLQVFAPLFEALNWAVALDDEAREHYAPEGEPLDWGWRSRVLAANSSAPSAARGIEYTTNGPMPSRSPRDSAPRLSRRSSRTSGVGVVWRICPSPTP